MLLIPFFFSFWLIILSVWFSCGFVLWIENIFCPLLIFQMRASGDPYLQHCVETASLLAMIGASSSVVAAGLLHDTLDDSSMSYDYIVQRFGAGVADLVEGV